MSVILGGHICISSLSSTYIKMLAAQKAKAAMKDAIAAASKGEFRDKLSFIFADVAGNDGALEYFGLKSKDAPAFVIQDQKNDAKYVSKQVEIGDLGKWLAEFQVRPKPCRTPTGSLTG